MVPRALPRLGPIFAALAICSAVLGEENSGPARPQPADLLYPNLVELTLIDYVQQVLEYNENVQSRLLAFQAARSQRKAESGIFEPAFVASGEYVDRQRPNTIEVERSLRSGGFFVERNQSYNSAIELRTPFGSKVRIGAGSRRLVNNVQRTVIVDLEAEFEGNVGISIEQPLLKGFGYGATMASIRLAARNSESAFQDYRRELMMVVAQSEMAYWTLHLTQAEYALSRESVELAETLVKDSQALLDAGRGSRLDFLEAQAGLAMRRSRESATRQKLAESMSRMTAYFSVSPQQTQTHYVVVDQPVPETVATTFEDGAKSALAMSPDLQKAKTQIEQEKIRVAYARNQRLPQLDLIGSFGASGLGFDYKSAWKDVEQTNFPAWTVALQMRVPLFGGIRERNELRAAWQRLRMAERGTAAMKADLLAGLDAALRRADSSLVSARNYSSVVEFRQSLLAAQLQGRDVGRVDSRTVLEAEQDLFIAKVEKSQSEVDHQRALLELQVMEGNLLQARGIDIEFEALAKDTERWVSRGGEKLEILDYEKVAIEEMQHVEPQEFRGEQDENPLGAPFRRTRGPKGR